MNNEATPTTDTAARTIGRLAAHWKFGNEMSALDFTAAANAALDPLRELERQIALESARLDMAQAVMRFRAERGITKDYAGAHGGVAVVFDGTDVRGKLDKLIAVNPAS